MMKLISNEFKKFSKIKLLLSMVFIISVIYLIIYFNKDKDINYIINTTFTFIPFIGLLVCILFGGLVSNEFQNGTIRVYLTKPYKRWKILISKYLFSFIVIIIFIIITYLSYIIILNLYFDYSFNIKYLYEVIINFIPVFFISTLVLLLSTITCSTAFSVGISIIICLISNIIAQIFFGLGYNIFQYTFLPYIDYSIFKDLDYINSMKNELDVILTIKDGTIILFINAIIFIILSINIFTRKDIKN